MQTPNFREMTVQEKMLGDAIIIFGLRGNPPWMAIDDLLPELLKEPHWARHRKKDGPVGLMPQEIVWYLRLLRVDPYKWWDGCDPDKWPFEGKPKGKRRSGYFLRHLINAYVGWVNSNSTVKVEEPYNKLSGLRGIYNV